MVASIEGRNSAARGGDGGGWWVVEKVGWAICKLKVSIDPTAASTTSLSLSLSLSRASGGFNLAVNKEFIKLA